LSPGHRVDRELLADANRLEVRAEQRRDADLVCAVVSKAVDLVDHGLNVEQVIAFDIVKTIGPSVIGRRIGEGYRGAARKRQRHRNRIDLRTIEIIDAFAARTVGPFIRRMLVGPCRASTAGFHHFKYGVHAQILVRQNGLATVVGVSHQKFGVKTAARVESCEIHVHRLVPRDVGADFSGAAAAGIAETVRLRRG
jgi:hypothetical protein